MIALLYAALLFGAGYLCGLFRPLKFLMGLNGVQSTLMAELDALRAEIAAVKAAPPAADPAPPARSRTPPV